LASFSVPENRFDKLATSTIKDILPENTLKTIVPQEDVTREVKTAPSRYRNEIAKFIVHRNLNCKRCGKCAEVCQYKVHVQNPATSISLSRRIICA
jgi:ferredoxin